MLVPVWLRLKLDPLSLPDTHGGVVDLLLLLSRGVEGVHLGDGVVSDHLRHDELEQEQGQACEEKGEH